MTCRRTIDFATGMGTPLSMSPAVPVASNYPLWRIARELRARPVAIEPRAFAAIDSQLSDAIASRIGANLHAVHAEHDDDDNLVLKPLYEVSASGVAIVKLHGICGRHLSDVAMACGGCDVDRVRDALHEVDHLPAVRAIVLDVDSPGGSVSGVVECADAVADLDHPCVAHAADQCASAAYWIASQADAIIVGPTADIGSVGVYCALLDESRAYDSRGLKVELVTSGENKAIGYPGTSLTEEQRALLQSHVDYVADMFRTAVLRGRAGDEPALDYFDGRCFVGRQAVDANFADDVGDMESAMSLALNLADAYDQEIP